MLKRFLVFVFDDYYPSGGWDDLQGSYDTIDEAQASVNLDSYQKGHVVDSQTGQKVSVFDG